MVNPRMMPHARLEGRKPALVPVYLTGESRQVFLETAFTENVSTHGARIVTRRRWSAGERLQVESARLDFRSAARVVYCVALPSEEFAVGLEFLNASMPVSALRVQGAASA
jgi:hypothetical protein